MRILVFRHVPFEDIGLIRDALHGVQIDYADLYLDASAPCDAAAYDALLFMGGPMSVNDDLPFIHRELAVISEAVKRGQPVLGICLGAQLLAKALSATVRRNGVKEIGWFPIQLTEAAAADPLLRGLTSPLEVFQWHGETFDLPDGATLLASSAACRNQAFRVGHLLYGFQFHPEVTPEMIRDWCEQDANCGDVSELSSPIDSEWKSDEMYTLAQRVFGYWRSLVQNRGKMSFASHSSPGIITP